jgi:hypothetical protein
MKRSALILPLFVLSIAALACNAPSRPAATPTVFETFPEGNTAIPAMTATVGIELPDIEGTVGAYSTSTPDPSQPGTISGAVGYPSEGHPAMRVYAMTTSGQRYQYIDVSENAGTYTLELAAGEYYILVEVPEFGEDQFDAGYTLIGKCLLEHDLEGAACQDTKNGLLAVLLQPGQDLEGIDIVDWFPTDDIFPPVPGS